jgi:hypothetical protein
MSEWLVLCGHQFIIVRWEQLGRSLGSRDGLILVVYSQISRTLVQALVFHLKHFIVLWKEKGTIKYFVVWETWLFSGHIQWRPTLLPLLEGSRHRFSTGYVLYMSLGIAWCFSIAAYFMRRPYPGALCTRRTSHQVLPSVKSEIVAKLSATKHIWMVKS